MSSIGSVGSFETDEREELLSAPPQFAPPQLQAPRDVLMSAPPQQAMMGNPYRLLIGAKIEGERIDGRILDNYIEEEKKEEPEPSDMQQQKKKLSINMPEK